MLDASTAWPQDIAALVLLDGGVLFDPSGRFRIEAVRDAAGARLHLVPRFRQCIRTPRRGLGGPYWVDAPTFDIGDHVGVVQLAAPADEAELLRATERLRRRRLDPSRPLWELWFLTGLSGGRVGLFVRMHHAIADGRAALTMVAAFLDLAPDSPAPSAVHRTPSAAPTSAALLADNLLRHLRSLVVVTSTLLRPRSTLRRLRAAWPGTRELLAEPPGSKTSLDRRVGPDRRVALIRTSLHDMKRIARAHDATTNDVLLALTAAGLRAVLRSRGEPVDGVTAPVYVPVSLRGRMHGRVIGNKIAQMVVPLRLGVSDPVRRLEGIAAETAARKARPRASLGSLFRVRFLRRLMLDAIARQRVNVTTASLPGSSRPLFFAGARLLEVFPILPLIGPVALGVGAVTYAGTLRIGVTADREAYPDLEVFAAAVRTELDRLGRASPMAAAA
jgi:WS/DGAT/MGAT family acyltransferase